jgi:cell wall-associated NlpC family hydrolase
MKFILLLSILLLSACTSVKSDVRTADSDAAAKKLTSYARSLVGIPYKYGGNSPDTGFDCSGFVGHVFRHTLGINLPRSSEEISHLGQAISTGNLRVGDLVFFNTLHRKFSHVGIYLGNDRFIHAPSSSTGSVRTEDMRESYWNRHYDGARRITLSG